MVSQDHRFHRKARISLNLNRPLSFVVWALAVSTLCCTWVESKLIRSVGYLAKKPKTKSKVLSDTVFTKNLNCSLLKSEIAFCIKCRYFLCAVCMLCPTHCNWEPETGQYGLPSHLTLAFFYSLYSCPEPPADLCRCTSMLYGFIMVILQHQWYPPPAQTTLEVVPGECEMRLVPPGL